MDGGGGVLRRFGTSEELHAFLNAPDERPEAAELLANLKRDHDALVRLMGGVSGHDYEDAIYRFWHQSFKVYFLVQASTVEMVKALRALSPGGRPLHPWFEQIIAAGTGRQFQMEDNHRWLEVTRPMLEAFWQRPLLRRDGRPLRPRARGAAGRLPSGWAALLYLYQLR